MSSQQFTLEYIVKLTGGSQAASQINSVTKATSMNAAETTKSAKAQQQYSTAQDKSTAASNKGAAAATSATRSFRGLTFGITGLVSSLVEALGMWGIYSDSATRVEEATRRVTEATKQYGENSKEARDATQELANAERAMNMVRRNTILSFFDMVTWVTLTTNAVVKLRQSGLTLGGMFSSITGIFNRFRSSAIAPAVTDLGRLGTTFTSFGSQAVTPFTQKFASLGTTFSTFRGTALATSTSMTALSTSFKATATSAVPLAGTIGSIGVASTGAAGGVGILSKALIFLKANIRGVMIATGIGAAVVALTLLAEHFLGAAEAAKTGSGEITKSIENIQNDTNALLDATDALSTSILSGFEETAKGVEDAAQVSMDAIVALANQTGQSITDANIKLLEEQKTILEGQKALIEATKQTVQQLDFSTFPPKIVEKVLPFKPEDIKALEDIDKGIKAIDGTIAKLKQQLAAKPTTGLANLISPAQINEALTSIENVRKTAITAAQQIATIIKPDVLAGNFAKAEQDAQALIGALQLLGLSSSEAKMALDIIKEAINTFSDDFSGASTAVSTMSTTLQTFNGDLLAFQTTARGMRPDLEAIAAELEQTFISDAPDVFTFKVNKLKTAIEESTLSDEKKAVALQFIEFWLTAAGIRMKDLTEKQKESTKETKTASEEITDLVGGMDSLTQRVQEEKQAFVALQAEMSKYVDITGLSQQQLEAMKQLYADNIQSHIDQANAIALETEFWNRLSEAEFQAAIAAQALVFAQIQVEGIFETTRENILLYNQAMIEGKQAAADFMTELALGTVKSEVFHAELLKVTEGFVALPESMKLTTEELQRVIEAQVKTGQGAEELANIVNERLAPAFETFNAAIQAESLEDFRKAFEEIDFGDLNKKTVENLEDLTETMKKTAEQGREMNNLMNAMTVHFDNLSKKDVRRIFDEFSESLQRVINLDPDAELLKPFLEFLDDLSGDERKQVFRTMGDDLTYLATAISDGDLTPEEVSAFYSRLGDDISNASVAVGEFRDELGELISIDIDPSTLGKQVQDVLGITGAIEAGKIALTPDQQFKNNTATLATNTGNLVTSTNSLKGSIDSLNSNVGMLKNIALPPGPIPPSPPPAGGGDDPFGMKSHQQLRIGMGEDTGQDPTSPAQMMDDFRIILNATNIALQGFLQHMMTFITYNNTLATTINQLTINTNLWVAANNLLAITINQLTINSNLWILANNTLAITVMQLTINTNLWILANNLLAITLIQLAINTNIWVLANNLLAITIVQLTLNTNLWIATNNILAQTIVQITSNVNTWIESNNTLAQTIVQITSNTKAWTSSTNTLSSAIKAATSAVKALTTANNTLARTINQVASNMKSAASAAKSLASAYNSAASAAKKLAAAQSSIGKASGGTMATGGIMSAASGRFFTTKGQTQVTVGDNPGGRETVAFIPHNDPGPTLEKIARMFGSFGAATGGSVSVSSGGSSSSGTPIIQVFLDGVQIKGEVVKMLTVNQGGMK